MKSAAFHMTVMLLAGAGAVVLALPRGDVVAADSSARKPGDAIRDVGKGFKKLGKRVGEAGRQAGLEVADAARRVWYKGKQVSKPRLDHVQSRTRSYWAKVIEGKNTTLEALRRENAELRRRTAERSGGVR